MAKDFYRRLHSYFLDVGKVLRNEADVASIFPNTTDRGMARENIYAKVLRDHLPPMCNVKLGGFVFGLDGAESKQLDVIISNDKSIQFNHLMTEDGGKSFCCIEGCIGVVSVKSTLDKKQLIESLENLASVPDKAPIGTRNLIGREMLHYEDWPYKVIFASDGLKSETLMAHLNKFYVENSEIPMNKRPNIIHVAGSCNIIRVMSNKSILRNGEKLLPGSYHLQTVSPDVFGLGRVIADMQAMAMASNFLAYEYSEVINRLPET
ncbi:DUF6602 domain-containing protein [Salinicola halophilus]|uniref:DUF6602 domain-containing protein n=1 Tax=Salinicola halophilus TaxID=184065 RepID=UPI0013A67EB1|nr:DUF6602 domain-containing protein [Salinicola halophilus]